MDKRPLLCQSPPRPPETHPSAASAPPSTYEPPPPPLLQPPTTPSTPRPAAAGTAPTTSPAPGSSPVTEQRNGGVAREGDIGQGSGGGDLAATSGSTGPTPRTAAAVTTPAPPPAPVSSPEIEEASVNIADTRPGHIAQGSSGSGSKTTDLMPFPPPAARPAEAIATPTLLPPGVSSPKNEDGSNSVSRSDRQDNDFEQGISHCSDGRGSTGSWWNLGDLFRSSDLSLPVTHRRSNQGMTSPSPSKPWFDPRQGQLLPDGVIQLRVGVCGFALYGTMTLLAYTQGLIKDLDVTSQVAVFLLIGFIWTTTAITIGCTMAGRTRLEHALSHHGTRLALLWITLLLLFNVGLILPQNILTANDDINIWSAAGFVFLICLATVALITLWVLSAIWGETDERKTTTPGH